MRRSFPMMLGLAFALTACSTQAQAQWGYGRYGRGYGGYGWGGWGGAGSTLPGSIAQGLGMMYMGAGQYNQQTAAANAINYDTMMRWNTYVYQSQLQATREYYARRDAHIAQDKESYNKLVSRINETPSRRDIEQGDALNAILDQLNDPRIQPSTLRAVDVDVNADLIREVPFTNASEAITISLEGLRDAAKWPRALRDPRFTDDQKDFEAAVKQARKEDDEGDITPETLDKIRAVVRNLNGKLAQKPLDNQAENQDAQNFIKTVHAMTRMLEKPQVEEILGELKKFKTTSVGNLLGFMRTFNLRFGPATEPKQRNAYNELYASLDQVRDKILSEAKLDDSPAAKSKEGKLHDFFSAMEMEKESDKKHDPKNVPPITQP